MLKKSSKGNKVSGKSDNDTEVVYGGEVTVVTKIFFVWMTGFFIRRPRTIMRRSTSSGETP